MTYLPFPRLFIIEIFPLYILIYGVTIFPMHRDVAPRDALDVFVEHRLLLRQRAQLSTQETLRDIRRSYPPDLLRRFEVYFKASSQQPLISVRELKAQHIGKLITARGIVTRATEVVPS